MIRTARWLMLVVWSALAAYAAKGPGLARSHRPDSFATYVQAWSTNAGERLMAARHNSGSPFVLLFFASLCLVTLELKVRRRTVAKEREQAERLAMALRSGVLRPDGGPPAGPGRPLPPTGLHLPQPEDN